MNKKNFKEHLINKEIRTPEIRLTGDGFNGEIVNLYEALRKAEEMNLDLVLFSEQNNIGICKIMNYEKYIYSLSKTQNKKQPKRKEIKFTVNIGDNDLRIKVKHIIEFLKDGHQVLLSLQFKGREMNFIDKGMAIILQVILDVKDYGSAEQMPKLDGKRIVTNLRPLNKNK